VPLVSVKVPEDLSDDQREMLEKFDETWTPDLDRSV
jgi:hypothetical protein